MQINSLDSDGKRNKAQQRVKELRDQIQAYLLQRKQIPDGITCWSTIEEAQERLMNWFGVSAHHWNDWEWQMKHRITEVSMLAKLLQISGQQEKDVAEVSRFYRFAISPYYLSLIRNEEIKCPIRNQAVPLIEEVEDTSGTLDPMAEDEGSPVQSVVQRYPDRIIINVTNSCAMYCRHCQRRRKIGQTDSNITQEELRGALDYVKHHEQIRDVLLTGGDALMLDDDTLDWVLTELEQIPHVEIKRIGTRVPVTLPMRVTDRLCRVLSRHLPLYLNTQFNHPLEITPVSAEACLKLARSGIALGNQSVLLAGINDNAHVIKKLNQMLLTIMVRPYYLFHAKPVKGTHHFRTPIETGMDIIKELRGSTSGLAIPTFVINAPGGLGKIALNSECVVGEAGNRVILKTWEGKLIQYENPSLASLVMTPLPDESH